MKDGDVAGAGGRLGESPDVIAEIVVHGQREDVGVVAGRTQHAADPAGAVTDRITFVGGRNPLIDDHDREGPVLEIAGGRSGSTTGGSSGSAL
jgi:hypothetical protein